ncbi:MAG: hypothetical protein RSF01_09075 [Bacteroidales bacterium]
MTTSKIHLLLLCVLFTISCGNNGAKPQNTYSAFPLEGSIIEINIDSLEIGRQIAVEEVFDRAEQVITLYNKPFRPGDFLVLSVDSLSLYILNRKDGYVMKYDKNGNTVMPIGKKGYLIFNGEYAKADYVTSDASLIYVLSNLDGRILEYNKEGEYIGCILVLTGNYSGFPSTTVITKLCRNRICDFVGSDNQGNLLIHYAYWDGNKSPYNYNLVTKEGKSIDTVKTFRQFNGSTAFSNGFTYETKSYYYHGCLHIKDLSDTLYYINNGKIIPKYYFKSKESLNITVNDSAFSKQVVNIGDFFETDKFLFFSYCGIIKDGAWGEKYFAYYDKIKQKSYRMKNKFLKNELQNMTFKTEETKFNSYGFLYFNDTVAYKINEGNMYRYNKMN